MCNDCCFQAKQHLKAEQLEAELAEGKKSEVADEPDSEDEDKYADRIDMPGQKFDTKRWVVCLLLAIYASLSQALNWLGQAKLQRVQEKVEGRLRECLWSEKSVQHLWRVIRVKMKKVHPLL